MTQTILVADDDPDIAETVGKALAEEGYRVLCAGDGLEALAILERREVDLLLTDHLMPRLTGLELLDYLRRHPSVAIPTILMSAVTPIRLPSTTAFLPNPFDLDTLLTLVAARLPD